MNWKWQWYIPRREEIGIWRISFCGGGKSEKPQENPWRKERTNNKHNRLITLGPGCEPGHSGEVGGALISTPSRRHPCIIQLHILSVLLFVVCYRPFAIARHPHFLIGSWHLWNSALPNCQTILVLMRFALIWVRVSGIWCVSLSSKILSLAALVSFPAH